ncbi:class I SAM-dependent methyltransferase [Methylovirgula sp. 4M-Z18]|uniref:class I SAM-dependent methyltransferase n=1 Tax=Methylovirgula sp. 4M-Z18 TaxID=2293567 RepID=UPI000E2E77E2|nr:class I SAM-dependent methyltransferase [Methylovirgula sp. 4M-Z18]RFB78952.1 class I SAM-dependent methyltransferase [Methylovirgula sp. 4M-Z18]
MPTDASPGHEKNADQIAYWNGPSGQRWTDRQPVQDLLLAPVSDILIARAGAERGERVLDIGCGCGATTLALAELVAPGGSVLGVDISEPMLARARQRTPAGVPADYALADATVHAFDPGRFDLLVSRFGVMFFAEPALSFANMRRALRPAARIVFACWRQPRENPWMMVPLQAVYAHVPKLPQLGPEDPGPFSFATEERVRRILGEAGFSDITMEPHDVSLDLAIGRGLDAATDSALEIGPASRALEGHGPDVRAAAKASVREALAPFVRGETVPLAGAIWIVTARA